MKCIKCGFEFDEGVFCPMCGENNELKKSMTNENTQEEAAILETVPRNNDVKMIDEKKVDNNDIVTSDEIDESVSEMVDSSLLETKRVNNDKLDKSDNSPSDIQKIEDKVEEPQNITLANSNEQGEIDNVKKPNSPLSIITLVLAIIPCTFFVAIVTLIIDLVKRNKDGKRHVCSFVALGFIILWIIAFFMIPTDGNSAGNKDIDSHREDEIAKTIEKTTIPKEENDDKEIMNVVDNYLMAMLNGNSEAMDDLCSPTVATKSKERTEFLIGAKEEFGSGITERTINEFKNVFLAYVDDETAEEVDSLIDDKDIINLRNECSQVAIESMLVYEFPQKPIYLDDKTAVVCANISAKIPDMAEYELKNSRYIDEYIYNKLLSNSNTISEIVARKMIKNTAKDVICEVLEHDIDEIKDAKPVLKGTETYTLKMDSDDKWIICKIESKSSSDNSDNASHEMALIDKEIKEKEAEQKAEAEYKARLESDKKILNQLKELNFKSEEYVSPEKEKTLNTTRIKGVEYDVFSGELCEVSMKYAVNAEKSTVYRSIAGGEYYLVCENGNMVDENISPSFEVVTNSDKERIDMKESPSVSSATVASISDSTSLTAFFQKLDSKDVKWFFVRFDGVFGWINEARRVIPSGHFVGPVKDDLSMYADLDIQDDVMLITLIDENNMTEGFRETIDNIELSETGESYSGIKDGLNIIVTFDNDDRFYLEEKSFGYFTGYYNRE